MVDVTEKYGIPEGLTIRTLRGGGGVLDKILLDFKKYFFSGYIKVTNQTDDRNSIGYIIIKEGMPGAAMYSVEKLAPSKSSREYMAEKAFERIIEEGTEEATSIELRSRVDVDEIISNTPESKMEYKKKKGRKGKKGRKAERKKEKSPVSLKWGKEAEKDEAEKDEAKEDGKPSLDEVLERERTESIEHELSKGKEEKERQKKVEEVYNLILKHRSAISKGREEAVCKVCGAALTPERKCPRCGSPEELREMGEEPALQASEKGIPTGTESERVKAGIPEEEAAESHLLKEFVFENFVVGPSNRFAHAAALAVANNPYKAYNPLFITSGAGLGKTHLLNAVGNQIAKKFPEAKITYITSEKFTNELIEAVENNQLLQFREKYRHTDVLIIDDIQFLAGKDRTQEEFFHTFNALHAANKQIILASDRSPKEIPTLKDRLISRFEAGLITDINPPDLETRMAILHRKAKQKNIPVPDEVLSFIAENIVKNIRELEGALNRVAAFSNLMGRDIDMELAKEVLRDITKAGEASKETKAPTSRESRPKKISDEKKSEMESKVGTLTDAELKEGHSYLVKEDRPTTSLELFSNLVGRAYSGMSITRMNPKRIKEKETLENIEALWLTDRESTKIKTVPPSLERIAYLIDNFQASNEKSAIFIDGLEYLISNNSFDAVSRFLRRLIDQTSEVSSVFILSVSPPTLKEQELKILEREMDVLGSE